MATPAIETREPQLFAVGDSLIFERLLREYLPSNGWHIFYEIRGGASGNPAAAVTFSSTASGDFHLISVAPEVTATWIPGDYTLVGFVTNNTDRFQFHYSELTLSANSGVTADSAPVLTFNQQMIAAIQAGLLRLAAHEIEASTVQQSTFIRAKRAELTKQLGMFQEYRNNELAAEALRNGQRNPNFIGATSCIC